MFDYEVCFCIIPEIKIRNNEWKTDEDLEQRFMNVDALYVSSKLSVCLAKSSAMSGGAMA